MASMRINKYDNLKGLAIFMILLWHFDFIRVMPSEISRYFYFIHLPIFFFVSGYFSKIDSTQPQKSFKRLLVPYFIFSILMEVYRFALGGTFHWDMIFIHPALSLWFLMALFIMKLILPVMDKFRYPILTSIGIALFFGIYHFQTDILGLSRTFGYLPVFLAGFYYNSYKDKLKTDFPKIYNFNDKHFYFIALLIIVISIAAVIHKPYLDVTYKIPYSYSHMFKDTIERFVVICCKIGVVLIFNRLMFNAECFLTAFGRNSMAVYLVHPFIYPLKQIWPKSSPTVSLIATLALAFIITFIFSRDVVTKYLNKFTDGVYNIITKSS